MKRIIIMIGTALTVTLLTGLNVSSTLAAAATPSPSAPAAGGGISLRPVPDAAESGAAKTFFVLHGAAGLTLHETVQVTNTAHVTATLFVSPVDGLTGQTSGSVFANRQDPLRRAGTWLTPAVRSLTLAAGATTLVPFTVTIPHNATAGDHLAGVAFENTKPTTSQGGFRIKQILRSVIGVLTTVPGPARFHPALTSLGFATIGTTQLGSVTVGLANDGKALGKPTLSIALNGPHQYHRSMARTLDTVLPADPIHYPFAWPDALPTGDYDITATLTGAGTTVTLSRHVHLGTPLTGTSPTPTPQQPQQTQPAPAAHASLAWYWLLAIVIGTTSLGFLSAKLLRRRPRPNPAPHDDPAAPQQPDRIGSEQR
jgi:hypothetical protein